jgi:glycosyltransferase involved in cell wall biosynthesis
MRILIHTDEYYPTAQACTYRMSVLAETFMQRGHDVVIITSSANKANGDASDRPEKILYSPTIRMKKKTTVMRMLNNLSFGFTSVFTAAKAGKADVVITTSPPPLVSISGWLIAKFKRAKLIYDVRDIWPDVALEMGSFTPDSFYCKVFRKIAAFMYKHADWITTVSPGKVEKIRGHVIALGGKKCGEAHADKVKSVGNGFDERILNSPDDSELVEKYNLDKYFTCVYIGNIGLAQGLGSLLDIAEHTAHKEVRFLLFGKGAEKDSLEKEAKKRGLDNVLFCGVLPHEQVTTLLSHAKLSFIPLRNSNMKDSIPTKVYEALGVGCPVLLFAEGDACDIVSETQMGRCVSPDHPELLFPAFDEMVSDYSEYISRRADAQKLMLEKYSRQQIALNFEKQLYSLVKIKEK